MPRYKFHVFNDDHTIDQTGQELAGPDAARLTALRSAQEIMAHDVMASRRIKLSHWIEIEDEQGDMTVVPFGDAIQVEA